MAYKSLVERLSKRDDRLGIEKTILIRNGHPSNSKDGIDGLSFGCESVITVYPYHADKTMEQTPFYKLIGSAGIKVPAMYIDERGHSHWFGNYLSMSNGFHLYTEQSGFYATRWVQGILGLFAFLNKNFLDDPYLLLTNGSDGKKSAVSAWDHRQNPLLMSIVNPPCALLQAIMTAWGVKSFKTNLLMREYFILPLIALTR